MRKPRGRRTHPGQYLTDHLPNSLPESCFRRTSLSGPITHEAPARPYDPVSRSMITVACVLCVLRVYRNKAQNMTERPADMVVTLRNNNSCLERYSRANKLLIYTIIYWPLGNMSGSWFAFQNTMFSYGIAHKQENKHRL